MDKRDGQPPEPGGEDHTQQQQQEDGQTTQPPPVSAAGGAPASPAASRRWSSSSSSSVVPVGRRKRSTPRHRPYEAEDDDEVTTTEIEVEEELDDSDYSDRYEEEEDEENGKRRSRRLLGSSTSSIDLNSSGEGKTLRNRKVSFQGIPSTLPNCFISTREIKCKRQYSIIINSHYVLQLRPGAATRASPGAPAPRSTTGVPRGTRATKSAWYARLQAPRPVRVAPSLTRTHHWVHKEVGSAFLFSNRPWRQSFHYKPSATFTEDQPRPADNGACAVVCVCVCVFGTERLC
jgi:hypothetical protein